MAPKPSLQSESHPADPRAADPELTDDGHVVEPSADDYRHATELEINHDWYKSAVFYEVLVRAFYDSDGNGKGAPVAFAQLSKNLKLTSADFFLV